MNMSTARVLELYVFLFGGTDSRVVSGKDSAAKKLFDWPQRHIQKGDILNIN